MWFPCNGAVSNAPHNDTTGGSSNTDVSLERKPGGFDHARPVQDWNLPECFAVLRRRLEADERHGTRAYVQVLRLLEQQLSEEELFEPRQSKRRFVLCTTDYVECVLIPPLIQRLKKLAPGVTIEIRILRDTLPEAELASGEIDLVLGFDEYMQVPGYLGKETWLTEPLAGLVRATLELEEERITRAAD